MLLSRRDRSSLRQVLVGRTGRRRSPRRPRSRRRTRSASTPNRLRSGIKEIAGGEHALPSLATSERLEWMHVQNIRPLHNYEPASTEQDAHDAALQYVRKVSGMTKSPPESTRRVPARRRGGRGGHVDAAGRAGRDRAAALRSSVHASGRSPASATAQRPSRRRARPAHRPAGVGDRTDHQDRLVSPAARSRRWAARSAPPATVGIDRSLAGVVQRDGDARAALAIGVARPARRPR